MCKASWNAAGAGLFQGTRQRHPARTLDCCYVDGNVQPHQRQVSGSQSQQECISVGCVLPAAIAVFPATHVPPATHAPLPCMSPATLTHHHACPPPHTPPPATHPLQCMPLLPHMPPRLPHMSPPFTEFLTKACENITLPQPPGPYVMTLDTMSVKKV